MQRLDESVVCSPSDLVNFLECEHLAALDRVDLDTPLERTEASAQAELIRSKGFAHEATYLDRLRASGVEVEDLSGGERLDERVAATLDAMRRGVPVIYQATFRSGDFVGHADFLRRVESPSALGSYGYEVLDTKLARTPKAKFLVQLCCYSELLAGAEARVPVSMHLVLGDGTERTFRMASPASRHVHLPLRALRADRVQAADVAAWHTRSAGRPVPARGALRRSAESRARSPQYVRAGIFA